MADMYNVQKLINAYYGVAREQAQDVLRVAEEAEDTIALGIVAIGDLMYHASENTDYDENSMRSDMFNIGMLLRCLGNFQAAIGTTIENCRHNIGQARGEKRP